MRVHFCVYTPSDGNIYKYMSRAFRKYVVHCSFVMFVAQIIVVTDRITRLMRNQCCPNLVHAFWLCQE
jgi:hypothetical protein